MQNRVVIQTDFGVNDGAVSAMYGVALSVNPTIRLFNLTHEIPQFNIWEASYRLYQTISYWPEETVFISVVDPGVGSDRKSVVAQTANNQFIVTPDNGTLTHVHEHIGIRAIREIDEQVNRLPKSGESYTFHGRDVYAYTGARLAANVIPFEAVGPRLSLETICLLPQKPVSVDETKIVGTIEVLDVRFGNVWTNIDAAWLKKWGVTYGDVLEVTIREKETVCYEGTIRFGRSFADSQVGEPILFIHSLGKVGVAINQASFAERYGIQSGIDWSLTIRKLTR